jgi:hypothetical protein
MTKPKDGSVDLLGTVEVLHRHLTGALSEKVFDAVRRGERRRLWPLGVLAEFWTAVILRAPPSLTHALVEASGGKGGYPDTGGSSQGFFERCRTLSWEFFAALFDAFQAAVVKEEPAYFGGRHASLLQRFAGLYVLDGSTLDQVARRLRILWQDRRVVLPGSIVALYDVARGCLAKLDLSRTPHGEEQLGARRVLPSLPSGALCLADALYGLPHFFGTLGDLGLFGLCRRNRRANLVKVRRLSSRRTGEGLLEDWVVILGTSGRVEQPATLRWIRWQSGSRTLELFTNVLDPLRLSAQEAVELYRTRWTVERMFYDLKEVLNLNRFYAANFNAIAMQVFASAIVYTALRTAQGRIARENGLEPEDLSTEKLFPKVAAASTSLTTAELTFEAVCEANPGVQLAKPDWRQMPFARTSLDAIQREKRPESRKKRRGPPSARTRRLPRPPPRPAP